MGGRLWTDEEIAYLRAHLRDGIPAVAKALNRTELAVYNKAYLIGLDVKLSQASRRVYKRRKRGQNESHRLLYEQRKNEGRCVRCGERWAEAGGTMCRPCREKARKWNREHDQSRRVREYKSSQRAERIENGRCRDCGARLSQEELGVNTRCARCRAKNMERTTVRRIRMRIHGIKRKN